MNYIWDTIKLRLFAFLKIPLINYCNPRIVFLDLDRVEVKIPLSHKTKNHVGSMYFGGLAVGADLSIGLLAMEHIKHSGQNIVLLFKTFDIEFDKRALGDTHFHCEEGEKIKKLVKKVIKTGERQNLAIKGYATCPEATGDDIVARFTLTLSLKEQTS